MAMVETVIILRTGSGQSKRTRYSFPVMPRVGEHIYVKNGGQFLIKSVQYVVGDPVSIELHVLARPDE